MTREGTLLLTRRDVASVLDIDDCIAAVEDVFRLHGAGQTQRPGVLGMHAPDGGFHIKAGLLDLARPYFAAKTNANFPDNVKRHGLPLIQGVIVLCDADNGYPLALMDSTEITILRTGAATAVAAKHLAHPNSSTVTVCGCGHQGRISIKALSRTFDLRKVFAYDSDDAQARRFSHELADELGVDIEPVLDLKNAVIRSDICVTCTPSKKPFLMSDHVPPGAFVAAIGADSKEKQELDTLLLRDNKVVVDVLEQCALIGELHHALDAGMLERSDVHAELGEVIAGVKSGRDSSDEIIVFDSTGMALQDVVAAATAYEKAVKVSKGAMINLAE